MFTHNFDPMGAEDWLRTMERELHTAQCDDREKVMYGPRLLRGAAQSWWESYLATNANPDTITCVTEPPKSLGPPTVVFVQRTSDNPTGAPDQLTSSVSEFLTVPKSVSPVTQTLQYIGGTKMRKQLQ